MKRLIYMPLAVAVLSWPVFGQVSLDLKIPEKTTVTTQSETRVHQILLLAGQELVTKNNQKVSAKATTGTRAKGGDITRKMEVTKWNGKWEFPGGIKMDFDSAVPERKAPIPQLEPILEMLRTMLKHPTAQVFDKDNNIKAVNLPEGALDGLPAEFKDMVTAKALVRELENQYAFIPNKAVSKGDTWVRDQKLPLGAGQILNLRVDYKYEGTVKRGGRELDRISGKITRAAYEQEGKAPGPLQVKDADLKPAKSVVDLLFDREVGHFTSSKFLIQVKGDMTFDVNGMELAGKLDLTMENNTVVSAPKKK